MASITKYETVSYEVEVPRTLQGFNNWEFSSGSTTGEDFKIFARLFKKFIMSKLPSGANLVNFSRGHYFLSGFVEKNGKFAYFSISDVRHFPDEWRKNILVRTAKSEHDYTGGSNCYTTLQDFGQGIKNLLERG